MTNHLLLCWFLDLRGDKGQLLIRLQWSLRGMSARTLMRGRWSASNSWNLRKRLAVPSDAGKSDRVCLINFPSLRLLLEDCYIFSFSHLLLHLSHRIVCIEAHGPPGLYLGLGLYPIFISFHWIFTRFLLTTAFWTFLCRDFFLLSWTDVWFPLGLVWFPLDLFGLAA